MKKTIKISGYEVTDPNVIDAVWGFVANLAIYTACQILGSMAMFWTVAYIWWHS